MAYYFSRSPGSPCSPGSTGRSRSATARSWRSARTRRRSCWARRERAAARRRAGARRAGHGASPGCSAGAAAARLRGPYLAGATLALAVGLPAIAQRFPKFLGRVQRADDVPPTPPPPRSARRSRSSAGRRASPASRALLAYVLLANLVRSRLGRDVPGRARRRGGRAARRAATSRARRCWRSSSAPRAPGLAGGLLVVVTRLAAPGAFPLALSVALLTGAILGGLGSLLGAALGAAALVLIPTWSDDLSQSLRCRPTCRRTSRWPSTGSC